MGRAGFCKWVFVALSLGLGGCSNLLSDENISQMAGPTQVEVPTVANLAIPADLQLPPPGYDAAAAKQHALDVAEIYQPEGALYGGEPAQTQGDILAMYGISKTAPDGTKKSDVELSMELRKAILLRKHKKSPEPGLIASFGNMVFKRQ